VSALRKQPSLFGMAARTCCSCRPTPRSTRNSGGPLFLNASVAVNDNKFSAKASRGSRFRSITPKFKISEGGVLMRKLMMYLTAVSLIVGCAQPARYGMVEDPKPGSCGAR